MSGASVVVALAVCAGLAVLATAAVLRLMPDDPARWHVDPGLVGPRLPFASYLVADQAGADRPALRLDRPAAVVAARLAAIIRATPRTRRIAGDDAFGSYVTRSALWGFPDYSSVRVAADGDGAAVTLFARARFGRGDLGVNRARAEAWLAALAASLAGDPGA